MSKGISRFAHSIGYKQDNSFYVQNGNVSFRQFKIQGLIGTRYHRYYRNFVVTPTALYINHQPCMFASIKHG